MTNSINLTEIAALIKSTLPANGVKLLDPTTPLHISGSSRAIFRADIHPLTAARPEAKCQQLMKALTDAGVPVGSIDYEVDPGRGETLRIAMRKHTDKGDECAQRI